VEGLQLNFTLLVQAITFIAAIFILTEWIFKPIVQLIQERQARLKSFHSEAHTLAQEVDQLVRDYEERLKEAHQQARATREELRREGLAHREQMLEEAHAETQQYIEKIRATIALQTNEARIAMAAEVERISREIANKILGRKAG
jgi:F-type H+-transporting ATPase subunit b